MRSGPADLDLRRLRYFVAVAERLHFGQAALALHVTQPALSRQIQHLEHDLGAPLLIRNSRDVVLTPAGRQLLHDAKDLLASAEAVQDRVRKIGADVHSLKVGFMLGTDAATALHGFSARHPEVIIELIRLRWWTQTRAILDGDVDIGFVRLPLVSDRLSVLPLYQEHLSVVLPAGHPLALHDSLHLASVRDEPLLQYADAEPGWSAVWNGDPRPDGTTALPGPCFHDMEELMMYVSAGRGVALVPRPVAAVFPRPDIVHVPVADVPGGQVALAWDDTRCTPLVAGFVEAARSSLLLAE
ncbi:LysR family transcriptional regulator [Streptomyces sp. NRRL B-24085]|uniref:LysR family transcriptional regulator n=1 Tax=Streptomyces sp. NRRL B-24085 TaxID=1709476 RepID=UPI0007C77437|nr:LysR substrate-binding domain-containing protein [Streptomyces sp. NRRL B-24085]